MLIKDVSVVDGLVKRDLMSDDTFCTVEPRIDIKIVERRCISGIETYSKNYGYYCCMKVTKHLIRLPRNRGLL